MPESTTTDSEYPLISRMTLRQLVGYEFGGEYYVEGTVANSPTPDADSFACDEFIDNGLDESGWDARWVWIPSKDTTGSPVAAQRRVINCNPSTGLVTLHRPYGSAVVASSVVEMHRWEPRAINVAINKALSRYKHLQIVEITPAANQGVYDLTDYPYILKREDIINVFVKGVNTNSATEFVSLAEVGWFSLHFDGAARKLYIPELPSIDNTVRLWLQVHKPYDELNLDTDETPMPKQLAVAATKLEVLRLMIQRSGNRSGSGLYYQMFAATRAEVRRFAKLHNQTAPSKINMSTPAPAPSAYVTSGIRWRTF